MAEKYFISPQELLLDSYKLGLKVVESDFHPNLLVGIWRGGTPVGIAVQEFLKYNKVINDHIAIRTSRYEGMNDTMTKTRVHGLDYIISHVNAQDRLLLVDDVYDTGLTIMAVIEEMERKMRKNTPQIAVATVYYKPSKNVTSRKPNFYVHETDKWLVFPHELEGLTQEEIRLNKGEEVVKLLQAAKPFSQAVISST